MSTIAYNFFVTTTTAPPKPDVYMTRRGTSNYLTIRYWDGARWHEIQWSRSRSQKPFEWPKKAGVKFPGGHLSRYRGTMALRAINVKQDAIQWGIPYKVFDEKEVLAYLVRTGVLPERWRTSYQDRMRVAEAAEKGGAA